MHFDRCRRFVAPSELRALTTVAVVATDATSTRPIATATGPVATATCSVAASTLIPTLASTTLASATVASATATRLATFRPPTKSEVDGTLGSV